MAQVAGKPTKQKAQDKDKCKGVKKQLTKSQLRKRIWGKIQTQLNVDIPKVVNQILENPGLSERHISVNPILMVNEVSGKPKKVKSKKFKSLEGSPAKTDKGKKKKRKEKKLESSKGLKDIKFKTEDTVISGTTNIKIENKKVVQFLTGDKNINKVEKKKKIVKKIKDEKKVKTDSGNKIVSEKVKKKKIVKGDKNAKINEENEKIKKNKKKRKKDKKLKKLQNKGDLKHGNKLKNEINLENIHVPVIKQELEDLEDISSDSLMIFDNPEIKNEPLDSDDADGSGPEGCDSKMDSATAKPKEQNRSFAGEGLTFYTYNTESGEVKIKTEPGIELPGAEIKNSLNANETEKKEEFLVCFKNFIKGTEEIKIKELSYTVLNPTEIVEFFLVKDRKKRFGFLKVASKEALEKVLKLDGWAVDGRIIRVQKSNLINVTKDPPVKTELDLKPPLQPRKRKIEEADCDVVEESILEEWRGDILSKVQENIENEGKKFSAYLKNLNPQTSNEQVRSFVESIVAPNQISRFYRPSKRNIAFVDLASKESLERVLKLNGSRLQGRKITIELSTGSQRKTEEDTVPSKSGNHKKGKNFKRFKKS